MMSICLSVGTDVHTGTLVPVLMVSACHMVPKQYVYWYDAVKTYQCMRRVTLGLHTRSAAVLPPPIMKKPRPSPQGLAVYQRAKQGSSDSPTIVVISYLTLLFDLYCSLTHTGDVAHTLPAVARACAPPVDALAPPASADETDLTLNPRRQYSVSIARPRVLVSCARPVSAVSARSSFKTVHASEDNINC
jgi:hypothetical protein